MTNVIIHAIIIFFASLSASYMLVPFLISLANRFSLYDAPLAVHNESRPTDSVTDDSWRKVHTTPTPRLGGVGIFLGFWLGFILLEKTGLWGLIIPGTLVFLVGVLDDFYSIRALYRFIAQVLVASFAVLNTELVPSLLYLYPDLSISLPYWIGVGIAVFIIVGAINAGNMIDGLDGLAAGLFLITIMLLGYFSYFHFQSIDQILIFSLPLIGGILGFLKYNTHPAKIFMGDGGSNFLGYFVGVLILLILCNKSVVFTDSGLAISNMKPVVPYNLTNKEGVSQYLLFFAVLLTFALPIYDSACVIFFRIKNKKSPFGADKTHLHHALLRLGLSQSETVTTLYFFAFIVGVGGLVPMAFPYPKYPFSWVPYAVTGVLLFVIIAGRKASKALVERIKNSRLLISGESRVHRSVSLALKYWEALNKYLLYAFISILPLFAGVQDRTIGFAAIVASALVFLSFFIRTKDNDFIDNLLLSIGIGLLLVVNNQNPMAVMIQGKIHNIHFLYNYLFVFMFFSSFLFVVFTMRRRYLEVSPTDFLLVGLPLILLLAPEPFREDLRLNIIGLRSLVVFMALRVFSRRNKQIVHHVRVLTLIGLIYVIFTSLFGFRFVY